ncbi:MAG: transporter substrate-binding domain-containing protein [Hyphomicrobium sp.]|nr:transporter substrate-binding domain-containing protein [Hyphomicrobium sp.]
MRALRNGLLLLWGSLIALLAPSGSAPARPLDEVIESKSLRVVAYLDNAPFSWLDGNEPRGIDVDLGRALARRLGVKAEIVLRMQGEKQDDDLRVNVWKGPLTGGGVGDVMMHVPYDRELALRNREAVVGNPYFEERVAVFVHPERPDGAFDFTAFKTEKIGVQIGTVADYFLMTYEDGAIAENVAHHVKPIEGAKRFLAKETSALMGVRSNVEGLLHTLNGKARMLEPAMPGIVRSRWVIAMAWKENSRDLGYALGAALEMLRTSGELRKIFARYKVTYAPPPEP